MNKLKNPSKIAAGEKYKSNQKAFNFEFTDSNKMMKRTVSNLIKDMPTSTNGNPKFIPHEEEFMKEVDPFRRMKINQLPNSKRTINPELAPVEKVVKRNYSKNNYDRPEVHDKFTALIAKTSNSNSITNCARAVNPRVYSSFNFRDLSDLSGNENSKREKGSALFKKYQSTTQIEFLPGGIKRDYNEIKDDQINYNRSGNKSFCAKVVRDYKSNVSCLPGKLINDEKKEKTRLVVPKKFESNNIFDFKENNAYESNSSFAYGKSFRRSEQVLNCFGTTNMEKDLFENSKKSRRPSGIRSAFESQIGVLK